MILKSYQVNRKDEVDNIDAVLQDGEKEHSLEAQGRGVLEAFVSGLSKHTGKEIVIIEYNEHTLGNNDGSEAMAYVQMSIDSQRICGASKSRDILDATLNAILHAIARV